MISAQVSFGCLLPLRRSVLVFSLDFFSDLMGLPMLEEPVVGGGCRVGLHPSSCVSIPLKDVEVWSNTYQSWLRGLVVQAGPQGELTVEYHWPTRFSRIQGQMMQHERFELCLGM